MKKISRVLQRKKAQALALPRLGLTLPAASRCKGVGHGDADAFRKSAAAMRGAFPDPSDALTHSSIVKGAARALLPPDLSALRGLAMCHARRHSRSDLRCGLPVELRWCRRLNKDSLLAGGWDAFGTMLRDSETRTEMRLLALTIKCLQIRHEGLDLTRFKVESRMWSLGQGSLQV